MHSYGVETRERIWTGVVIGAVATVLAFGGDGVLSALHVTVPWFVGAPTPLAVFGVALWLFDHVGWRVASWLRLSRIPDLRGTWDGWVSTMREGQTLRITVRVFVRQTWQCISIELHGEHSTSTSTMASIDLTSRAHRELTYGYRNEPRPVASDEMHMHRGTARLELSSDGLRLTGDYYSGRDRGSVGTIELRLRDRHIRDGDGAAPQVVRLREGSSGA